MAEPTCDVGGLRHRGVDATPTDGVINVRHVRCCDADTRTDCSGGGISVQHADDRVSLLSSWPAQLVTTRYVGMCFAGEASRPSVCRGPRRLL